MSIRTQEMSTQTPIAPPWEGFWSWAGGVSVRTKILGIVLALTAILGLGVTWQVRTTMAKVFIGELEQRGLSVVSDLAARAIDPILLNDSFAVHQLLTDTVTHHPDALYAFVIAADGHVIAHTFGETGFPLALLELNSESRPGNEIERNIQHQVYNSEQGTIHDFRAPIFEGRSGTVRLGLSENRLSGITNAMTGQMLLTTLVVALAGIAAAILLTWLLTRPILALVETTRRVGGGNLTVRAPHWADDEIGALADAFNQMLSDLESSRQAVEEKEQARTRLLDQLIQAQEEERKLIARDLHDGVGQSVASLILGLRILREEVDAVVIREQGEMLRQQANAILEQVRLMSRQIHPALLDDLGLAPALNRYADEFREQFPNMDVDLHCSVTERLPQAVEITLYRVIQEAMTNAARHSGGNTVSVVLQDTPQRVQAIIEDNGHGFDPVAARREGRSVGLHSMSERVELLGGHLEIESSGEGTTIFVEIGLL